MFGWGGLGRFIVDGFAQRDFAQVAGGAILVAAVAVATELAFAALERLLVPVGIRRLTHAEAAYLVSRPV
jgi:osmoprotectant transport system permease protein